MESGQRSTIGTRMMEPEEFWAFFNYLGNNTNTQTCLSNETSSGGILYGHSQLTYYVPLLILQMSLASYTILFTSIALKPLGQPLMVAQILGGILLGPSFLSQSKMIARALFPLESFFLLDLVSLMAIMFYFFLIGVYMDTWIVKKIGKKAFAIGIWAGLGSIILPVFGFYAMYDHITDASLRDSVGFITRAQTLFTFPCIARYLYELNILNSEFGAVALSSSIVGGLLSFLYILWHIGGYAISLKAIFESLAFVFGIIFVVSPVSLWMIRRNQEGHTTSICSILVAVIVSGLAGYFIGLHIAWGPFILGLAIPPGPPLGAELIKRLEVIVSWILMPIFFLKIGLAVNIYSMRWENIKNIGLIILVGCFGKSSAAFIAGLSCKLPWLDALSISLVVNVKGVLELTIVKGLMRKQLVNYESFVMTCTSMLIITMVITCLLKAIYNPSKRYLVYNRRTVMDTKLNDELRLLMCIHKEESVPPLINILEATNHVQQSPIFTYVLHFVELVGRATPLLISHRSSLHISGNSQVSKSIVNAFSLYEEMNKDTITVSAFTAITPASGMHDDVCKFALEKRAALVILPFHEQMVGEGSISQKSRTMNLKILENAPCSVAILVERGLWSNSRTVPTLASWLSYRVAVLFMGGPDDREALAIGTRMSGNANVNLLLIRILSDTDDFEEKKEETKLDNDIVNALRNKMADNDRFRYVEETVTDGTGTVRAIQLLRDDYQLIMTGRRHDTNSPATTGLAEWNQYKELGTIGDLLASPDLMIDAMILVVQQHSTQRRVMVTIEEFLGQE